MLCLPGRNWMGNLMISSEKSALMMLPPVVLPRPASNGWRIEMEFPFNENSDNASGNVKPANKVLVGKSFVELGRSPLENTSASCETGATPPTQLAAVCHRLSAP